MRALAIGARRGLVFAAIAAADVNDPKTKLTKADQAAAAAAVLRLGDLGPAWTGGPETPNSIKIPICPANQPRYGDLTLTGHAESGLTLAAQGVDVDTDAELFKSKAQVSKLVSRVDHPGARRLPALRPRELDRQGRDGRADDEGARRPLSAIMSGSSGSHLTLKSGGKTVHVLSDYLFLSSGRTQFFVNIVAPVNVANELPALESRIAKTLALRGRK